MVLCVESAVIHMKPNNYFNGSVNLTSVQCMCAERELRRVKLPSEVSY